MRRMLIAVFLLVPMLLTAQEMSSTELVSELSGILNDYETAYDEIKTGLNQLKMGLEQSKKAQADLQIQIRDLENSSKDFRAKIEAEIIELVQKFERELRQQKIIGWLKVVGAVVGGSLIGFTLAKIF